MVAAQPGRVCLIPVAYGSSTAWSCVLDPSISCSPGIGHSGEVTRVKIAPNKQHMVSVSTDGGILRWELPPLHSPPSPGAEQPSSPEDGDQ